MCDEYITDAVSECVNECVSKCEKGCGLEDDKWTSKLEVGGGRNLQ